MSIKKSWWHIPTEKFVNLLFGIFSPFYWTLVVFCLVRILLRVWGGERREGWTPELEAAPPVSSWSSVERVGGDAREQTRSNRVAAVRASERWCLVEGGKLVKAKRFPGHEVGKLEETRNKMDDWQSGLSSALRSNNCSVQRNTWNRHWIEQEILKKKLKIGQHCFLYPSQISCHFKPMIFSLSEYKLIDNWHWQIWQVNHWRVTP